MTKNNCCSQLLVKFIQMQKRYPTSLNKIVFKLEEYLNLKTLNFMAPFHGWGSAVSRLQSHYQEMVQFLLPGDGLLFTIQFLGVPGTQLIDLGRMKG